MLEKNKKKCKMKMIEKQNKENVVEDLWHCQFTWVLKWNDFRFKHFTNRGGFGNDFLVCQIWNKTRTWAELPRFWKIYCNLRRFWCVTSCKWRGLHQLILHLPVSSIMNGYFEVKRRICELTKIMFFSFYFVTIVTYFLIF